MSHLDQALTQHGFALVRTRKHQVYKRVDGTTFVTPSTPSDVRWERPALADFARIVGKTKRELTSHALPTQRCWGVFGRPGPSSATFSGQANALPRKHLRSAEIAKEI